jgi:Uri superfamily endonuclease
MKPDAGTYALLLQSHSKAKAQIGRLGQIQLEPGYYIYVGSAFGPGGVRARVSRHFRRKKPSHWHIDYLGEFLTPYCAWYSHDKERLEHRWADVLSDMTGMSTIKGFGCSDCKCLSHLFHSSTEPELALFPSLVGCNVESWSCRPAG